TFQVLALEKSKRCTMHDEFGQESVSARCLLTFAMRVLQLIGFPMKFLHNSGSIGLWRNTEIRSPSPTQKSRCTLVAPLRMWPRQKN
ncbi:hypothetical protein S245_039654, partial [Arachis hypogaea]